MLDDRCPTSAELYRNHHCQAAPCPSLFPLCLPLVSRSLFLSFSVQERHGTAALTSIDRCRLVRPPPSSTLDVSTDLVICRPSPTPPRRSPVRSTHAIAYRFFSELLPPSFHAPPAGLDAPSPDPAVLDHLDSPWSTAAAHRAALLQVPLPVKPLHRALLPLQRAEPSRSPR